MTQEPKSLQEAIVYFSNPDNCIDYLAVRRWPNGVTCPGCGSPKVSFNANRRTWKCGSHHPKREFSVKVGTIFEDSPISLDKWLTATWMLTNCKNGVSSYEIARNVRVTQKSAWFMLHRIRLALQDEFFGSKLNGEVEVDETFIGGKARNMHVSERKRRITGTGTKGQDCRHGHVGAGRKDSRFGRAESPQECIARAGTQACHCWRCTLQRRAPLLRRIGASSCRPRHTVR